MHGPNSSSTADARFDNLLMPAAVYDHAPSEAAGRFRLGFGRDNLPECLARLEEWLERRYRGGGGGVGGGGGGA